MKAYLRVTGTVFALITVAHLWRICLEGSRLAREPIFVSTTALSVALSFWAWRLHRRQS